MSDNLIDATKANRFVNEIEKCFEGLESERGTYMNRCKTLHERIKDWKQLAADDGIPKKALNAILKERVWLKKIAKLNDEVRDADEDGDVFELLEDLRAKLKPVADLPLFGAAIQAAEDRQGAAPRKGRGKKTAKGVEQQTAGETVGSDPLSSLVSDDLPPDEEVRPPFLKARDDAAAEANAAALAGMKTLKH